MNLFHIPYDRGIRTVHCEEIIRIESMSNYSKIHFTEGSPMVVAKVLHWFEDLLPCELFARIHRSHLINRQYVKEVSGTGYQNLLLRNGEVITMSRRKKVRLTM